MKKHKSLITIGTLIMLICIPFFIAFMFNFKFIITDTQNDWIGFWGGYLGAIVGGMITLYVMFETNKEARENIKETINNDNELAKREEKIEYFNRLASVSADYLSASSNMCAVLKKTMTQLNFETYFSSYESIYFAARKQIELEILLKTRKDTYRVNEIIEKMREIEEHSNKIQEEYERICKEALEDKKPADKINREEFFGCANGMFDRIPNFLKTVEKIIYDNINK